MCYGQQNLDVWKWELLVVNENWQFCQIVLTSIKKRFKKEKKKACYCRVSNEILSSDQYNSIGQSDR